MSLFSSLFKSNNYLGVEIGTTTIKVVEVERSEKQSRLKNYGILETYGYLDRFNNVLQTSSMKATEPEIAAYLGVILRQAKIKTRAAIAALPAFSVFTTLVELPELDPEEVDQAMQFQVKQYVPMPLSTVRIDYFRVGERTDESGSKLMQMLLTAIPIEQIERYQKIFKTAGLDLKALEIEGMSLARIFTNGINEPQMIIDIGARSTSFSVAQNGILKFQSQTDFAGGSLTQALASGMNLAPKRAEEIKRQKGLLGTGGEYELSTLMMPLLDVIINEANRARENFERIYRQQIKGVILVGGGSNLPGIEDYCAKQLNIKCVKGDPFAHIIFPKEIKAITKNLAPAFAVALGASLKEIK